MMLRFVMLVPLTTMIRDSVEVFQVVPDALHNRLLPMSQLVSPVSSFAGVKARRHVVLFWTPSFTTTQ